MAGALNQGDLCQYSSQKYEALIELQGKPMVEYVVRETQKAERIDNIVVVGPDELAVELPGSLLQDLQLVTSENSLLRNVQKGVEKLDGQGYVLLMTGDIPLIRSWIIDEFIKASLPLTAKKTYEVFYPLISIESCYQKYPGTVRTSFSLAEGEFTAGNLIVIKREILPSLLGLLEKLVSWRKKPVKLVRLLGFVCLLKYIFGSLAIQDIEKRIKEITDVSLKGMVMEFPEIGFDIDKQKDLEYICENIDLSRTIKSKDRP